MEAFERGECVEVRTDKTVDGQWCVTINPLWDWNNNDYRIEPKPKQTVTIEKWLCEYCGGYVVVAGNDLNFMRNEMFTKVKLLDTYEVEL